MRYGIFSDIHSNLEAFEAVIEAFAKEGIDKYLCIGDIIGYAADPKECIKRTKELNPIIVAGNHDWAVGGLLGLEYFTSLAKKSLIWTSSVLDETEKIFLSSLDLTYTMDDFILVHGTVNLPERFDYLTNISSAYQAFGLMKAHFCFVGHSHIPLIFAEEKGRVECIFQSELSIEEGKRYIVNVGSVGQPRDQDPRASYCIFDSDKKEIQIKRVNYDIQTARDKIINNGLPRSLGDRLLIGK